MRPGGGLFILALIWLFLGTAGFFSGPLVLIWLFAGLGALPLILADALILGLLTDRLRVRRETAASLVIGKPVAVTLIIERGGKGFLPAAAGIFDLYPNSITCSAFPAPLDRRALRERGRVVLEYTILPVDRGGWEFPGLEILLGSPLRLWRLKVFHRLVSQGRTYPDFKKMAGRALEGIMDHRGIRTVRRRGQGLEFQNLREYQKGDSVKAIDWRATGRRGKIIIREYQEEQDQQVLLLLDSGYRLHRREESPVPGDRAFRRTQFDSALEAALLLSYVALKHGDAAAAGTFGAEERWFPPRKGLSTLTGLMSGLYDLKSAPVPSSPFSALENALARLHRRTFIILISNFREEDGESLAWILPRIEKRHLLLVVSLREPEAEDLARRRPREPGEVLETAAAFSYLAARRQLYKTWEHWGLLTMETSSADLSPVLINRYLRVKRSGRL
jgi:uncharacterized protein (DUF58 family)